MDCIVCSNDYDCETRIPLILKCGHTLCKACLEEMHKRKRKLICP